MIDIHIFDESLMNVSSITAFGPKTTEGPPIMSSLIVHSNLYLFSKMDKICNFINLCRLMLARIGRVQILF